MLRRAVRPGVRRRAAAFLCAVAALLFIAPHVSIARADNGVGAGSVAPFDGKTQVVRLRSFARRASGRLEVEPTRGGGRVRLTALNLPTPQSLAPKARTFVAWASGGRILRLGELRRGAGGFGLLVFQHPSEFTRYSLIVTAEADARAERPTGAPVFSTRANEVAALFPAAAPANSDDARAATAAARRERRAMPTPTPPAAPVSTRSSAATGATTTTTNDTSAPPHAATAAATAAAATTTTLRTRGSVREGGAAGGEFFTSVDEALRQDTAARTLVLVGDRGARRARGTARVATSDDGTAYVRVRFRRVPPPSRFGRGRRYAMWALIPEDGTVYMGTLPARDINRRQTYARTEGVKSNKFRLLVTAERRAAPAPRPIGRRVLMTFKGRRRR